MSTDASYSSLCADLCGQIGRYNFFFFQAEDGIRYWSVTGVQTCALLIFAVQLPMANPFVHVELSSNDLGAAKTCYGKLFDWKLGDMPMGPDMTYTMINVGEGTGGDRKSVV